MKSLAVLIYIVTVAIALTKCNEEWIKFKTTHSKNYGSEAEELQRKNTFFGNLRIIKAHNNRYGKGEVTFKLGVNQFADMTNEEFVSRKNRQNIKVNPVTGTEPFKRRSPAAANASVDWRTEGCVAPGQDQGQCGSSWAFCVVAAIEDRICVDEKPFVSLSAQNLIDCSWSYGNFGCDGGSVDSAFQYVVDEGIDTEASYPNEETFFITHSKLNNCRYDPVNAYHISRYVDVHQGDEDSLTVAVNSGPVTAAIDASHISFQLYKSGVYNEPRCSETQLDLNVIVAGYGTDNGIDYWLVQNLSFGTSWGEKGYIEMTRDGSNQCGIATQASYPVI